LPGPLQPAGRVSDLTRVARPRVALALLWLFAAAGPAHAASSLRFPVPTQFGEFEGETLDPEGVPLGPARIAVERDPHGRIVLEGERGIAGQATVRFYALFEPVEGSDALQLILQRSRTLDPSGATVAETAIDHASSQATCTVDGRQQTMPLPEQDRVANVPIDMLLAPIARGELDELDFQALVCSHGFRLVDVSARRTGRIVRPSEGTQAVEIEYEVRLNPILARIARPFLPRILFWIDPAASGPSLAQRLPLFPTGPTIFVVRRGIAPGPFLAR
jgi:hypothetical protein